MQLETIQLVEVALIIIMMAFSAFFSGSETSYTGLSHARLKAMDPDGKDRRVQRALLNMEDFDRLLTTILVGNNIVNTAGSAICTALLISVWPDWGTLVATILMITVLLVVGEITPKTMAKRHPEDFACRVATPIHIVMVLLSPITAIFLKATHGIAKVVSNGDEEAEAPSDEETAAMIDEILEEGTMEAEENKLIRSAMEFDDTTVGEICVPRVDIVAVSGDSDEEAIREAFVNSEYTRIPVYEGTIDHIIGYVSFKDCFLGVTKGRRFSFAEDVHPVKFFPENTGLDDVFRELQKSGVQIGVVLDEYGGTYGMVTMEDLVEELVGEIYDETDDIERNIVVIDGAYIVPGSANLKDTMENLGIDFDVGDSDSVSVGGYIAYMLERIPRVGDEIRSGDVVMTVRSYRNRRVREVAVKVEPLPDPEEGKDTDP